MTKYQKRISGPLLDRIDIHVEVPRVEYQKLSDDRLGEASEVIRPSGWRRRGNFSESGLTARQWAQGGDREGGSAQVLTNADMRVGEIRQHCKLDAAGESLVRRGDGADEPIRAGLPPCAEAGPNDRGSGGQRGHPGDAPGRGAAVSTQDHDGVRRLGLG